MAALRHIVLLLILAIGLPASALAQAALQNIDEKGLETLLARKVPLVDIRTPAEWAETGIVPGAHRIMAFDERGKLAPDFLDQLAKVAKPGDEVALICRTGSRTRLLGRALVEQVGYGRVYNVERGIKGWMAAGGTVSK